jgi:hypothetical protein
MPLDQMEFVWRGHSLQLGRRKTPVLTLITDPIYSHLFRIRYPNGWTSTPANLSRAKDAAYGHARHLLVGQAALGATHSLEESAPAGEVA